VTRSPKLNGSGQPEKGNGNSDCAGRCRVKRGLGGPSFRLITPVREQMGTGPKVHTTRGKREEESPPGRDAGKGEKESLQMRN